MTITYTTKITSIDCWSTFKSVNNLAFNVWWNYIGSDGTNESNVIGNTFVPYDSTTEFVPYEQLTEEEVLSWVQKYTDPTVLTDAQALITSRINEMATPPLVINPTLPWTNI